MQSPLRLVNSILGRAPGPRAEVKRKVVVVRRHPTGKQRRSIKGATNSRLTHNWPTSPVSIDQEVMSQLSTVRARSRDLRMNNEWFRRFDMAVRNNVVGPRGMGLHPLVKDADGKPDTYARETIRTEWARWAGSPMHCDPAGRLTFQQQQTLGVSGTNVDGELLARIRRGRAAGEYAMQVQLLDPQLLDVSYNRELRNGSFIRMGIEYDAWERPLAYHIMDPTTVSPHAGYFSSYFNARDFLRIPAADIVHVFIPEVVGQKRGLPWCTPTITRGLRMDHYEEAALVNADVGASKMGVLYTDEGEEYTGADVQGGSEQEEEGDAGEVIMEAEAGSFEQLPHGMKLEGWMPDYPHEMYDAFVRMQLMGIAAGLGMSYAGLSGDRRQESYSAGRAGIQEERVNWQCLQWWLSRAFCQRIYQEWLDMALLAGKLPGLDPLLVERYHNVLWQTRGWDWVDPLKDMQANVLAIKARLTSRRRIIAKSLGEEAETVWQEVLEEEQLMEQLGLSTDLPDVPGSAKLETGKTEED